MDVWSWWDKIVGLAILLIGIRVIVTQRVAFSDEDDEPYAWYYGWRALVIGCFIVAVAIAILASVA